MHCKKSCNICKTTTKKKVVKCRIVNTPKPATTLRSPPLPRTTIKKLLTPPLERLTTKELRTPPLPGRTVEKISKTTTILPPPVPKRN